MSTTEQTGASASYIEAAPRGVRGDAGGRLGPVRRNDARDGRDVDMSSTASLRSRSPRSSLKVHDSSSAISTPSDESCSSSERCRYILVVYGLIVYGKRSVA